MCDYLKIAKNVELVDLLANDITSLGCEFLAQTLSPMNSMSELKHLKLDHNNFGAEGVAALAKGLCQNDKLQTLSMTYCNIDEKGARPIFEILIYQKSALEELNLTGNHLRDSGTIEVLRGLSVAKSLKNVSLADN